MYFEGMVCVLGNPEEDLTGRDVGRKFQMQGRVQSWT